jgi:hypothetical protein
VPDEIPAGGDMEQQQEEVPEANQVIDEQPVD